MVLFPDQTQEEAHRQSSLSQGMPCLCLSSFLFLMHMQKLSLKIIMGELIYALIDKKINEFCSIN